MRCSICKREQVAAKFTNKQRKKAAGHRKCKACIRSNSHRAMADVDGTAVRTTRAQPSTALLHAFVTALRDWEPGLVAIIEAVLAAQTGIRFTRLRDGGRYINVSEGGRRVTHTCGGIVCVGQWPLYPKNDWSIATPALSDGGCVGVTVHRVESRGVNRVIIGVIGTTNPDYHSFRHTTAHGWGGTSRGHANGAVYVAGQEKYARGWPSIGWQTGDEAALMLDKAAGMLTLKHRRLDRAFTISLAGAAD